MENKVVYTGKVIWLETKAERGLYLDMPRKPEDAHLSFPLCGAFGFTTVEEIFKPYIGKNISIKVEKKEAKIRKIEIEEA
jgi:hypothetical protein